MPDLNHDVYVCSGGPGNPLEGDGVWDVKFYNLMQSVWDHNLDNYESKKYMFFFIKYYGNSITLARFSAFCVSFNR